MKRLEGQVPMQVGLGLGREEQVPRKMQQELGQEELTKRMPVVVERLSRLGRTPPSRLEGMGYRPSGPESD
jgi:hypothetical protein